MKNLLLLCSVLFVFASCEKEQDELPIQTSTADLVASVLSQEANPSLDNSYTSGLYKGIFATHDLSQKGAITLNINNNGDINAAVKFITGPELVTYFTGTPDVDQENVYHFTSENGQFTAVISPENKIQIPNFDYNNTDSYISAYKTTNGASVSVAFGTFVDTNDATFMGNWDILNNGSVYVSPAGEHSTFATTLLLVEEVVISKNGNMITNTDLSLNDSFTEICFYNETFPHGWFYDNNMGYREIIAYNQTSTFAGNVATWNLAYYFVGGDFFYDTPTCGLSDAEGFGNWSWNGRTGTLKVQTLSDL